MLKWTTKCKMGCFLLLLFFLQNNSFSIFVSYSAFPGKVNFLILIVQKNKFINVLMMQESNVVQFKGTIF